MLKIKDGVELEDLEKAKVILKNQNVGTLFFKPYNTYIEIAEAIKTVLQELEQLQEENKELKIKNKIAEEDIHDLYISNEHKNKEWIHKDILNNYISKDKIKKYKLKFIKDSKDEKTFMTQSSQINASLISFCNELLESEE